jgi:diguanylate cyclase (GGDEF)-like protein
MPSGDSHSERKEEPKESTTSASGSDGAAKPMPDASPPPPAGPRVPNLRTKPIDATQFRDALLAELRKHKTRSLAVVAGPNVGTTLRLERSIDLGRDPATALPLGDESVSWRHVRIEDRGAGEWAAVDLGSTNGTLIDGERIVGEAILKPGDRIFLGGSVVEFKEHDAIDEGFNAKLDRMLNEDDLSGLWVKRRFDAQLKTTVAAVQVGTIPVVSVLVMDLDGIKGINDTHGHDMGAFCIGECGKIIGRIVGSRGFATRFGGDEYAAGLPGIAKQEAVAVGEQIRQAIAAHVFENRGIRVQPGISIGVAALPGDAVDSEALFRAGDEALYRAKRAGKNRVAT